MPRCLSRSRTNTGTHCVALAWKLSSWSIRMKVTSSTGIKTRSTWRRGLLTGSTPALLPAKFGKYHQYFQVRLLDLEHYPEPCFPAHHPVVRCLCLLERV